MNPQDLGDLGIIDLTAPTACSGKRMRTLQFNRAMNHLLLLPLVAQSFASLVDEWNLIWTAPVTEFEARR
jgi:hypothetical protein